jgi:Tol biopolymer transport system component
VTYVKIESGGNYDVWRRRADGTGAPELLPDDQRSLYQGEWSVDGEWMVFRTLANASVMGERDIVGFRPGVDDVTIPLVATAESAEQDPALSPDGRWLAYTSNETGRGGGLRPTVPRGRLVQGSNLDRQWSRSAMGE